MYNGFKNAYKYVMKYYYKHTRYGNLIYCKKKQKNKKTKLSPNSGHLLYFSKQ